MPMPMCTGDTIEGSTRIDVCWGTNVAYILKAMVVISSCASTNVVNHADVMSSMANTAWDAILQVVVL